MKRILTLSAILLLVCSIASAAPFRSSVNAKSATDDSVQFVVGSTNTLYTKSLRAVDIRNDEETGIMYRAIGSGTINIYLSMEQSFGPPSTEGASSTDYIPTHTIDSSITSTGWNLTTVDTVLLPYIRFRAIGKGSNAAGTLLEIKVSK